jgi:hypothetical protein
VSGSELVKTCIFMFYKYKIKQTQRIKQKKGPPIGEPVRKIQDT